MLTVIEERTDARNREVLGDRERHGLWGQQRERHRSEVVLEVAEQRVANSLAVADAPRDERAGDLTEGGSAKQDADLGDQAHTVSAHRERLDVEHGQAPSRLGEFDVGEPTRIGGVAGGGRSEASVADGMTGATERGADPAQRIAGRSLVIALVGVRVWGPYRHVSCIP